MSQVNVPGVGLVNFPDGMADADIEAAITKNLPDWTASNQASAAPGAEMGSYDPANADATKAARDQVNAIPGMGMAESLGSGVVKGVAEMAGIPGDVKALAPTSPSATADLPEGWYKNVVGGLESFNKAIQPPTSSDILNKVQEAVPLHDPQNQAEQALSTIGEFVPGAVTGSSEASIPARVLKYAVAPGAAVQAASDVPGLEDHPYVKTGLEVAAGLAAPGVASNIVSPNAARLAEIPVRQQQAALLQSEGIQPTPGDILGDTNKRLEESEFNPQLNEQQMRAFTVAAGKRIGLPEPNITIGPNGNLPAQAKAIGDQFDAIPGRNTFQADPQLYQDLLDTHDYYHRIPGLYDDSVTNAVDGAIGRVSDVLKANPYQMSGADYQTLRSDLRSAAMGSTDDNKAGALHDITNALDDSFERGLQRSGSPDAAAMPQLRQQYQSLLTIEKARLKQGSNPADGYITPQNLQSAAKSVYGNKAYMNGNTPFTDLAEAGASLLSNRPNSGTAGRASVQKKVENISRGIGATVGGLTSGGAGMMGGLGGAESTIPGILFGEAVGAPMLHAPVEAGVKFMSQNPVNQWRQTNQFMGVPNQQQAMIQALLRGNTAYQLPPSQ